MASGLFRGPLIVNIYFDVLAETVRIRVPEADIDDNVASFLGYSHRDDQIVSVGLTQDEVLEEDSHRIADPDQKVEFINPFKGEHFNRKLAEYLLHHYVASAYEQIRDTRLSYWMPGTFDELRVHLKLDSYDSIPRYVQNYFARGMKRLPRLGEFTVNGRVILGYE